MLYVQAVEAWSLLFAVDMHRMEDRETFGKKWVHKQFILVLKRAQVTKNIFKHKIFILFSSSYLRFTLWKRDIIQPNKSHNILPLFREIIYLLSWSSINSNYLALSHYNYPLFCEISVPLGVSSPPPFFLLKLTF